MKLLFVCTGNTCRSPMAEGIFKHLRPDGSPIEALSAGLMASGGSPASKHACAVCAKNGIDLSAHRARQLTAELAESAELILTMTAEHADFLCRTLPQAADKIHPLLEYTYGQREDVSDPYGGDEAEYEACFHQLYDAVSALQNKLPPC